MSREVHVRFWESPGVRFPRATQLPLERQVRMMKRFGLDRGFANAVGPARRLKSSLTYSSWSALGAGGRLFGISVPLLGWPGSLR
jgi:hypothetical protein